MPRMFQRFRRTAVGVGVVVGASLITVAMAVPAGATTVAPGNTVLNEGGSQTTYLMMQQLSDLYNSAPGCQLLTASGNNQELDYDCAASYSTAEPGSEEGYTLTYSSVNPYNDVAYQEPPLGSSNGIKELELEGADTPSSAPDNDIASVDFARSSRAAITSGSGDDKSGLNFVAYAADAVPWFHFTKVVAKKDGCTTTPSSKIKNLTTAQLASIYNGDTTNWKSVGGTSAPIDVFIAQSGSGTESTWSTDLALTGDYPYGGATATATRLGLPATDFEIFENEVSDIFTLSNKNPTDDIACDAIFFFSYGKYSILCSKGACAGTPNANKKSVSALGEINGVTASKTTILNGSFALDRQLYNVYSDGSNSNLPFANNASGLPPLTSQAVQNFVSTYGFLCNPTTHDDVDPLSATGETYGTEIDAIITAQGFFPLTEAVEGDASIPTPPDPGQSGYDANYAAADPTPKGDKGYCRVTSTDGDGND